MAKLLKFFIYSNLLISLGTVALVETGALLLEAESLSLRPLLLIFSATFLIYNLNIFLIHLIRKGEEPKRVGKMAWFWRNRKWLYSLIGINSLLLVFSFPYHSWKESLFFLQLGLISLLYNVPDRYAQTTFRSIRGIPLIKIFLIAYVWASIGAFYPALRLQELSVEAGVLFALFFMFIVAITLPFDIRDYYSDRQARLLTVPGLIGTAKTKALAIVLIVGYALGIAYFFHQWMVAAGLLLFALPLIAGASAKSPDWYFTGLVDSLLLLHYFLLIGLPA